MSNHTKGYHRDNAILGALKEWQVLNTEQIQLLFFKNVSLRMAQKRLQRLTTLKKIHRQRDYIGQSFYYYLEQKPGQSNHKLGVNWIRLWLQQSLKSWEVPHLWQYEPNYKSIRPDAFVAIKNVITGKLRFCFIERECDTNPFKKVKLYNDLYSTGGYCDAWWTEEAVRFPIVVVVVETTGRMETVKKLIEKDNKHGLEFKVYLLNQIVRELKGEKV